MNFKTSQTVRQNKGDTHAYSPLIAESYYFVLYFWQLSTSAKRIFMAIVAERWVIKQAATANRWTTRGDGLLSATTACGKRVQQLFNSPQLKHVNKSDKLPLNQSSKITQKNMFMLPDVWAGFQGSFQSSALVRINCENKIHLNISCCCGALLRIPNMKSGSQGYSSKSSCLQIIAGCRQRNLVACIFVFLFIFLFCVGRRRWVQS